MMRHMISILLVTLISPNMTFAGEPKVQLDFRPVADIGEQAKSSQGPNGEPAIEVRGEAGPRTFTLIISDHPKISSIDYRVRGRVKYNGIEGDGYLELLNDFGPKGTYFSRTLGDYDPMRKLKGTSEWREFELPFHSEPGLFPKRLTLNIVLPGAGQVVMTQPIVLEELGSNGEWWSVQQGGLVGGLGGGLLGIIGALFGVLMTWNQTREIVRRVYPVVLIACYAVLAVGIIAVCLGQPYHVYFPTLLIGIIGVSVLQFNYFNMYHQIRNDELRKMTALDVN